MAKKTKKNPGNTPSSPTKHRRGALLPPRMTMGLSNALKDFASTVELGYSDANWTRVARCLYYINDEAPPAVVEKLGRIWADAYVTTEGISSKVEEVVKAHYSEHGH